MMRILWIRIPNTALDARPGFESWPGASWQGGFSCGRSHCEYFTNKVLNARPRFRLKSTYSMCTTKSFLVKKKFWDKKLRQYFLSPHDIEFLLTKLALMHFSVMIWSKFASLKLLQNRISSLKLFSKFALICFKFGSH